MAEDDEIDILGDEGIESFIPEKEALFSNNTTGTLDDSILVSDCDTLLEFEYTVHPQWLSDKPSANWYENLSGVLEPPTSSKPTTSEQCKTDSNVWSDMEKNLLNRGIEIFGKSATNLAQIIGSKTEGEVRHYLRHHYAATENFKENIILDDLSMQNEVYTVENGDSQVLLDDIEIPASMEEEVISTVSTTPKREKSSNKLKHKKHKNANTTITFNDIPSGQSLLKKNHVDLNQPKKLDQSHKHKKGAVKKIKLPKKNPKVKFKIKAEVLKNYNNIKTSLKRSKRKSETLSSTESEASNGGHEYSRPTQGQVIRQVITTGEGLSVPFCEGEKIIRIKKESDTEDSDTEIDIEDSSDDQPGISSSRAFSIKQEPSEIKTEPDSESEAKPDITNMEITPTKSPDLSQLTEEEINTLMGTECPESEYVINDSKITNLEKFINYDFFDGVGANTPERYLKIRTHILHAWRKTKPSYVTKTSIRPGLKNCGDVKYISKVHTFLEQIGAINFNCGISYIRPLCDLINVPSSSPKQKKVVENNLIIPRNKHDRHRHKQKMIHFNDGQGGYTTQHDEEGEVMNTTIVNEDRKKRTIKKHVPLITCRPFPAEAPQQYKVRIQLSTLLIMDLHAHASLSEVMGLIGGSWDRSQQLLTISKYEPCKNIASSTMHCEMCPVSQSAAAGNIHAKSLQILGWFHSHPSGAPEPSQQDIDTQLTVQRYIRNENPCVGVIMSPFSAHGALIASPFRCMVVRRDFSGDIVPYKLSVLVDDRDLVVDELVSAAKCVFDSNFVDKVGRRVNFEKPYFQNDSISYLDKFISSVKMHLAKCSNINKMTCDEIVDKLSLVCTPET